MNDFLLTQYANMKDWLKHAEAKNAVLLSLCSVGVFKLVQIAIKMENEFYFLLITIGLILPLSIGLLAALLSLFPQLSVVKYLGRASQNRSLPSSDPFRGEKSLIYFGDLLNLKPDEYLNKIRQKGDDSPEYTFSGLNHDMALQIVILAQITYRKFTMFQLGLTAMLVSAPLLSIVVSVFYFLIKNG
ncbi:MAG: DUF5706 domain-containing protein [Bacteroidia bacterium]|nr:DUF5706 domain-containing protein [Bacteroidia bacterium]